jgi:hypothetical protein
MAYVVEHLPSKPKAVSLNSSIVKKERGTEFSLFFLYLKWFSMYDLTSIISCTVIFFGVSRPSVIVYTL